MIISFAMSPISANEKAKLMPDQEKLKKGNKMTQKLSGSTVCKLD